jgi:RNA polymerase sigma factor (sigma-70 family)
MHPSAHVRSQALSAPDAELVRAARAGQVRAFGELVERHQALARAIAFSACGELSVSEDIAQEALVTAWLRLGDLDDPSLFRYWLATIVRNTARYVRRHQRRHAPAASVGVDALANLAADQPTPRERAQAREELDLATRKLRDLPRRLREPLLLYHALGESHAAVAATLELSEPAVRQRISRARKRLKDQLGAVERATRELARRGGLVAAVLVALEGRYAWSAAPASSAVWWASPKLLWAVIGVGATALTVCIVALAVLLSAQSPAQARSEVRATSELPPPTRAETALPRPPDIGDGVTGVVELGAIVVEREDAEFVVRAEEPAEPRRIRDAPVPPPTRAETALPRPPTNRSG